MYVEYIVISLYGRKNESSLILFDSRLKNIHTSIYIVQKFVHSSSKYVLGREKKIF